MDHGNSDWKQVLARYDAGKHIDRITLMSGQVLRAKGHRREAISEFETLLEREPANLECLQALSSLYRELGNREQSGKYLERYYQLVSLGQGLDTASIPDLIAFYMACEQFGQAPDKPPRRYIEALFDRYASEFESSLQDKLQYAAPGIIKSFIYGGQFPRNQRILDLGCGTGLIGARLRDCASKLDGVDLSAGMLKVCEAKGVYNTLVHADVHDYLNTTLNVYDLVVAIDVFNYLGDLQAILNLCRSRQPTGSLLAFTAESANEGDIATGYQLAGNRRYRHKLTYLQESAINARYICSKHELIVLRKEQRQDVHAHLVLLVAC